MAAFYKEMFRLAVEGTPGLIGSNWVNAGFTLLLFVSTYILKSCNEPRWKAAHDWPEKLTAMQEHWARDVKVGVVVVAAGWLSLFVISLTKTLYHEHAKAEDIIANLQRTRTYLSAEIIANATKQKESRIPQLSNSPGRPLVSAPNGIAIGGSNLGTATVNNTISDVYPRPGVIPNVNFCVPGQTGNMFTVTTDTKITSPFWAFIFDGPVTKGTVEMDGSNHEPFSWRAGRPAGWVTGGLTDPLGTLPENSRLFINADANTRPYTDDVLRIQVTEIGLPFGGPYRPWGPGDPLKITVESTQPVRLIAAASGSLESMLPEHMTVGCTK